jgi:glutamate racemase
MTFNKKPSNNNQPIGIFDSGVGGISVLKHIHALLPHEDLIYLADSKYAPYGNKTPEEIIQRCLILADDLLQKNVKAIVVACNTATAAAIDTLRETFDIPIIGMEPAVKPAAEASKNGIIGVLATVGTLKSAQFAALLEAYGRDVKVVTQACMGLVECIERGELDTENTKALIRLYTAPLLAEGADTIVLGCTHYPFVKQVIQDIIGQDSNQKHITLIDTGAAVAKQLKRQLEEKGLLSTSQDKAEVHFWTNSEAENASQVTEKLWGKRVEEHQLG